MITSFRFINGLFLISFFSLFIISCGGSGGSGGNAASAGTAPYIYAELESMSGTNSSVAVVYVIDAANGNPYTNAVVTVNNVSLSYNASYQGYHGNLIVAPGDSVTLTVNLNGQIYAAIGRQFTSYPAITSPVAGGTWRTNTVNDITWTSVVPDADAFYGVGVVDNDSGRLIWPSDGYLATVSAGVRSYRIWSNSLTIGKRSVLVSVARFVPIPGTAAGSGLIISGFSDSPITVVTSQQTDSGTLRNVTWGGGQFVAVGELGRILTSSDGLTWTTRTSGSYFYFQSTAWSGTKYVIVSGNGGILTSPDGVSWDLKTYTSFNPQSLTSVVWSGSQFVAVGYAGTIITSPDGVNWTAQNSGSTAYLFSITWSGTQFVIVGENGIIITSPDGINWTPRSSGTTNSLQCVIWTGTGLMAVGSNGTILTSSNGVAWLSQNSGVSNNLYSVASSGTKFIAVGSSGSVITSSNGVIWSSRPSGTTVFLGGITWSGTQFVAVGDNGQILILQ